MASTDSIGVRVFSLNCWGIRYLSKHVPQRYAMIGDMLSKEKHDIVLLQEVWSEKDYLFLKQKLSSCHPYSHYFKSGVIGSGLAIFSKHRIQDALLYRYSLNGYPYMAHHGDWFGGKAVGLAILNIGSLTANVYVTHLHAEYCRDRDSYLPHRVVQAWELQQFVRHTSAGADVVILGGDLNMHPQDLGCRLLRTSTGLKDSYLETSKFDGCENGVTLIPENPFICKKELGPFDKGIRIDYILFKGSSKADISCDFMCTTKGSVADQPFPYSDHEAVTTHLRLKACTPADTLSESHNSSAGKVAELVDMVTEARTEVKVGLHCAERMRYTTARTAVMGLALLFLELAIVAVSWLALGTDQPFPRISFYMLAALCVAILLATSMLYVFYTMELKSLQGAEDQMRLIVGSLQAKLKGFPLAELGDMASSREELLLCRICLLTYTEPVTTPCGHNYCKACITEYLSCTDEPQCPLCKEALQTQLELKVNTELQNLVQHFSNITVSDGETPAEAWEVTCDMCCEPKLKAQRSCLKCVASYCQHHLEQHQREATFEQHQLVDPVSNLEAHVCRDHNKLLTSFCEKDQTCVCATCLKENHLRHEVVPLEHAFREKKDDLVRVVSKIEAKEASQRSRMEDLKSSAEQSRREWEKKVKEIDQAWNSLEACLQRGHTELAELVQERQKAAQVKNDHLVASLEQDIAKLQSKRGELELVLQKGDQMYLLQNFTSLSKVPRATRGQFHSSLNKDANLVKNSFERMQAKLSEEMEKLKNNILLSPP